MSELHQTDRIRLRPFQFSLRRLLAITTLAAILFVFIAPWLRQFPEQLVAIIFGMWIVAMGIFCGLLGFGSIYFDNVLRRAGPILCVLPRVGHVRECLVFLVLDILQVLLALVSTRILLAAFGPLYDTEGIALQYLVLFSLLLWFIAFSLGGTTLFMLRSRYAAVCENGLIHVAIFIPWRRVRGDQWREAKDDNMRIVFRSRFRFAWKFEVAAEDLAEVEQVLEQVRPKYHGGEAVL